MNRVKTLSALSHVTGCLLLALPAYLLTWGIADGHWPETLSPTGLNAIIYLGVIATLIGFVLYYYLLTRLTATRVALITLVSPVLALLIGHTINHEPLTVKVLTGTLLICSALITHQFFDRIIALKQKHR